MNIKSLQLKRALRSVLLVLLLNAAGMAKGQYFESDGVWYEILEDNPTCVAVISPDMFGGNAYDFVNLVLPNPVVHEYYEEYGMQHDEYTLVTISGGAFGYCESLVSIEIPNSVTTIGWGAFYNCTGLASIEIPNSVTTIEGSAFYNCTSLASIELPNSLTSIEQETFYGCTGLTGSLTIPISVTTIGHYAFYNCSGFTGSLTIPNSVTTIGDGAFYDCSGFTGNLIIPNSVTGIGDGAFLGCSGFTDDLIIGNSVTVIENNAFYGCSGLISFNIPNSVRKIGQAAFRGTGWYGQQPDGVLYKDNWYLERKGLPPTGSLIFNEGTIGIADATFANCSGFTGNLIIPGSVRIIGDGAFEGCSGFTGNLIIPNSVTYIGYWAFQGCVGLTGSLIIGNSVTMIGSRAFAGCNGFKSITSLAETPPRIEYGNDNATFYGWTNSTPVYVPCGFEEAYASTRSWSRSFSNYHGLCGGAVAVVATPEEGGTVNGGGSFQAGEACTVTAIANEGHFFAGWTQDGKRVSTDVEYTFYVANDVELVAHFSADGIIEFDDVNVKAICVSHWDSNDDGELSYSEAASVKSLGDYFQNNSGVTSFDELQHFIGLSSIVANAFSGCSGLASIVLPESITWIGSSAFNGCSGLTGRFTIPKFVTRIDYKAFYDCSGFTSITVQSETPPSTYSSTFYNVPKFIPVHVPCGSLEAYQAASGWNEFTNIQESCTASQAIILSAGWNWFSANVGITLDDLKDALVEAFPGATISINSQSDGSTTYIGNTWRGNLTALDPTQMYMISVSAEGEITLEGLPFNPTEQSITIHPDFNWFVFPLSQSMTLTDAFAGFAVNGDMVISQDEGSSTYTNRWRGTLETLEPGKGYMYKSNDNEVKIFVFPSVR